MVINYSEICDIITNKYKINYILVDEYFKIKQYSTSISKIFNNQIFINEDVRCIFYELIGYERDLKKLELTNNDHFELKKINKNNYYINIFVKFLRNKKYFLISIEDVTIETQREQLILQNRNTNELLLKEIAHKNKLLYKYQKAAEDSMPMIYLNAKFEIINTNSNFNKLIHYDMDDMENKHIENYVDIDDKFNSVEILNNMSSGFIYTTTLTFNEKSGNKIYAKSTFVPLFNDKNILSEILVFISDMTIEKESTQKLATIARKDNLTTILNRFGFEEKLDKIFNLYKNYNENFALMFLDLDDFKKVNDNYGHQFGDIVLKQVSIRLKSILKSNDTLARYGGDEFIVILEDFPNKDAIKIVINKIIEEVKLPLNIDNITVEIGISIGVAIFPQDSIDKNDLIKKADSSMYFAKRSGKNRYYFYEEIT